MQYYDQRKRTLKRIIKTIAIVLVTIVCIVGIYFLINLHKSEQNQISLLEQQEQQRMLALRPLYEEKNKLEKELADITSQRSHAVERSPIIIPLLTDCSETLVHEISNTLQPYDYPAVICINDTYYPGAEDCISIDEAKELVKQRWEFMIDASSNIDKLTDLLLSSGLTKPVAIYSPSKDEHNENANHNLPLVCYGNQNDKTLFSGVYGMQVDEIYYVINEAIDSKSAIIMTTGTVLSRETYDKTLLQEIFYFNGTTESNLKISFCTYSENAALQAEYSQQQQKVIEETEAEFQSISEALNDIEEQIERIETSL